MLPCTLALLPGGSETVLWILSWRSKAQRAISKNDRQRVDQVRFAFWGMNDSAVPVIMGKRIRVLSLVGLLLIVTVSSLDAQNFHTAPRNGVGPSTASVGSPFGVEATSWNGSNAATLASEVAATGATWTRVNLLQWRVVQPQENSQFDWTSYDAVMEAPAAQGLTPIVIIGATPWWAAASATPNSDPIDPAHLSEFAAFVSAAVARYSQPPYNVKYWELYNEPDSTVTTYAPGISSWGNDGAGYAAMLKAAYPAIKAADPDATVLFGSLAYDWFTTQGGPFNRQFLDDALNAGAGPYFDVLGFHYYAPFAPNWNSYGVDILGKVNYLRADLASHGLGDKPMICTEIGQLGDPADPTSLEQQASYVPQVYARGMSIGLLSMMWYSLVNGTDNTGLLDNTTPKPAYTAYKVAVSELGQATFVHTVPAFAAQPQGMSVNTFEGYVFRVSSTGGYRAVVWMNQGSATFSVTAPSVDVTPKYGGTPTHLDAGPDGRISFVLDTDPVYLDFADDPWHVVFLPVISR